MEIFGGFMAMMSMATLFLAIVWLIMPFVVFAIKGKQERTMELLEEIKKQLSDLQHQVSKIQSTHASKSDDLQQSIQPLTVSSNPQ